jgi:hypothetical protein
MVIHRPNVREKVYRPNLQTRSIVNRKFYARNHPLFTKRCNWCKRPNYWSHFDYPGLCTECGIYINRLEGLPTFIMIQSDNLDWASSDDIPF